MRSLRKFRLKNKSACQNYYDRQNRLYWHNKRSLTRIWLWIWIFGLHHWKQELFYWNYFNCPFFIKQHFSGILCLSNKHYDRGKSFYLSFLWYVTSYCQLLEICFKCWNHRIFVHNYLRVLSNVWATRWLLCTFSRMSIEQDGVSTIVTIFFDKLNINRYIIWQT